MAMTMPLLLLLHLHLLPLLLLQLPSYFLISSAYTLPDKYFLNCGSESDVDFGFKRRFIGDTKPTPWPINPGKSKVIRNNTIPKSINEIYATARVYNEPTWYVFGSINQNGTYVLRLHFFPLLLSSQQNLLLQARFNVFTSCGFQLLSNFSVQTRQPVVKEFAFEVETHQTSGLFGIQFSPNLESSHNLAFVNAIELFLAPQDFKPESSYAISPQARIKGNSTFVMTSHAFQAAYRLSMGGSLITPDNDTLWRTWLPDDGFMARPSPAKNVTFSGNIEYGQVITIYTAPTYVYSNAKALLDMNTNKSSRDSNITWVFKVKKNTTYFIRFHWCDIIEQSTDEQFTTFRFDYFIGVNRTWIDSSVEVELDDFAKPFRYLFIVVTDDSGYFNVGIARNEEAPLSRAFLNGFEMMELIKKSFVGPVDLKLKLDHEKLQNQKLVIIGVCVGGAVIIVGLIIGLGLCYFIRNGKSKKHRPLLVPQNDPSEKILSLEDLAPNLNLELKISYADIFAATNDFDEKKMIGVGGFGKVYVATIGDKEVAVKRSQPGHGQGIKEFQTEVIILSKIRHRYLVSLCGYCDENQEMILVYEYMEGGTLKDHLYGSKSQDHLPLSWKQRLEICINAAKGLDYLHTGTIAGVIIHRDIKTTNILLDKDSNAKVADFGISRTGAPDPNVLETTLKGTYGYLDPEYLDTWKLTEKSDIYAFGIVLLEVLSARPPIVSSLPNDEINLADWAVLCKSKGEIEKVIDPFLVGTIEENSLRKFVEVAVKCVDNVGANRPSMHGVVSDLELALQFQFTPIGGGGKGFEDSTTIFDASWQMDSGIILDGFHSRGLNDSVMMDEDSMIVSARELVEEMKIDCAR